METNYSEHGRNSMIQHDGILPEDILIDILSALAVKDLVRLRCVCKSWCSLIDDVNFIKSHYRLHYSICKAFLCCDGIPTNYSSYDLTVSLLSKQTSDDNVHLDLTPNLIVDTTTFFTNTPDIFRNAIVVGTALGVVCILWMKYQNLGLWNPATREFKALTPWVSSYRVETYSTKPELTGFGFDSISDDFKTLRGKRYRDETQFYELHSLKTNSWKRITEPTPLVCFDSYIMGAYLNGFGYWIVYASDSRNKKSSKSFLERVPLILSFNFHTEVFEVFNPPDDVIVRGSFPYYFYEQDLAVYKDCLAIVVRRTNIMDKEEYQFDVSVATEVDGNFGTPLSWKHLFTWKPFCQFDRVNFGEFRMDGNMVLSLYDNQRSQSREFVHRVYNPTTDAFKNMRSERCMYFEYVESLFPLSERRVRT